jgi:DNA-binding beta-propeller fold protein YncE
LNVGSFGSGESQFSYPQAGAMGGPDHRIYIADTENDRIQVFSADGALLASFGSSGAGPSRLAYPMGVAVDAPGNILVSEADNNRLQLFHADGTPPISFGSLGIFDPADKGLHGGDTQAI